MKTALACPSPPVLSMLMPARSASRSGSDCTWRPSMSERVSTVVDQNESASGSGMRDAVTMTCDSSWSSLSAGVARPTQTRTAAYDSARRAVRPVVMRELLRLHTPVRMGRGFRSWQARGKRGVPPAQHRPPRRPSVHARPVSGLSSRSSPAPADRLPVPLTGGASAPWLRRPSVAGRLAACVLLGFRIRDPFTVPLVWAGILACVSWPAYRWLRDKCRGHTTVAALLMTGAVTAAVIAPLAWLAVVLRVELAHTWRETQTLLAGGVQLPPAVLKLPWIGEQLRDLTTRAV